MNVQTKERGDARQSATPSTPTTTTGQEAVDPKGSRSTTHIRTSAWSTIPALDDPVTELEAAQNAAAERYRQFNDPLGAQKYDEDIADVMQALGDPAEGDPPTLLPFTDHPPGPPRGLLYPGRVHWLYGPTESAKSWVAIVAAAAVIAAGGDVLYLDYEDDVRSVVRRFLALGVDANRLGWGLHYQRIAEAWTAMPDRVTAITSRYHDLVIIDGVTEALAVDGLDSDSADDVARWKETVPRAFTADGDGTAVVCIDHIAKGGNGRWPYGSQHKLSGLDGAAYLVEVRTKPGIGRRGELDLRVRKDRPGEVRRHAIGHRSSDDTALAARVVLDSTLGDGSLIVDVLSPADGLAARTGHPTPPTVPAERPTERMAAVAHVLENAGAPLSRQDIERAVRGRAGVTRDALAALVVDGHVEVREKSTGVAGRTTHFHRLIKPYPSGGRSAVPDAPALLKERAERGTTVGPRPPDDRDDRPDDRGTTGTTGTTAGGTTDGTTGTTARDLCLTTNTPRPA